MRGLCLAVLLAGFLCGEVRAQGAQQGGVNPVQTDKVVSALTDMFDACRTVAEPYRPDCASRAFQRGARKIANNPGYWEAHVALIRAARTLDLLVRENADGAAGSVRLEGYRLKPVAQSALPGLRQAGEVVFGRAVEDLQVLPSYEREAFAPITDALLTERPWP